MPYDPEIHHRRSIRLRGYDYSQPGSYYVTLCTQGKEHLFGQILEGEMHRNEWGDHVARCWEWLGRQYPYIDLDDWIVMPNHLHGIIVIADRRGGSRTAPTAASSGPIGDNPLKLHSDVPSTLVLLATGRTGWRLAGR